MQALSLQNSLPASEWAPVGANGPLAFGAEHVALYERLPFAFQHRLAETGLFTIPRLVKCAEKLLRSGRGFRFVAREAQDRIDSRFDDSPARDKVPAAFDELESGSAWMKLNNIGDVDRDYAQLLDDCIDDVSALAGHDLRPELTLAQFTVFCSSPGSVTPYHIDHEVNFLCQVAGEKVACVWDPADRSVLSEREIERFYAGEINAAKHRDDIAAKGHQFVLRPGVGVHHPPLAPHWVRTGDSVAISVSLNLCLKHIDRRAHVYQANHLLRRLGMRPAPPGRSNTFDRIKGCGFDALSTHRPKSAEEVVFSGLYRLRAPMYWVRGVR